MANNTNDSSYSDFQEWQEFLNLMITKKADWVHILFTVVMVAIFVAGVCGNLLICVVIACDKSMHTATNYYLFNLAVTDLLVAFGILLELDGYILVYNDLNDLGDLVCKIHFFLVATLWNTDILTVTALAIERYIAIFYPLLINKKPERRRLVKIICFIWLIAILETLPQTWTIGLIKTSKISICSFMPTPFTRLLNGILSLVTFIIPLVIMIFVYTMVAFRVNTAHVSYARGKIFNHRNRSSKVNKLIMALTVSFVVCWLPFFGVRVVFAMDLRRTWIVKNWDLVMMVTSFNCWFSIVMNPLLFSLVSTKFRRALKKLCNTKIKKHPNRRSLMV